MEQESKISSPIIRLKEKDTENITDIEIIEFLFNNTKYNLDNFLKEESKDKGWQLNEDGLRKLGVGSVNMQIPMTEWADIKFFEFNSFLTNTIRTINFLLEYKLRYYDKKDFSKQISISQYILRKGNEQDLHYSFLEKEFSNWISKVNKLRNEIIHKRIIRKIEGHYKVSSKLEGDEFKTIQEKVFGIREYKIENLNVYIKETFENLERFVIEFIELLNKS